MKNKLPKWLEKTVFYEIYPQSFNDTNRDGIGDLKGIIQKLDYVKTLGCNALWINPCFVSPFQDAGYDVADYYKVAPRYGTNADLKLLFKEAHKKGIRVILDLVPGHTSLQHPWFKESCKPEKNKYTDWYIWTDGGFIGAAPDDFSISGYCDRDGQYVTNFFCTQPALNYGFANPNPKKKWQHSYNDPGPKAVRAELQKIIKFWLDAGADGFRVDLAFSLVKLDKDAKFTSKIWSEVRAMMDKHYPEAMLISEWGKPDLSIKAGFHCDFMLHFGPPAYNSLFRNERENKKPSYFGSKGKGNIKDFLDYYKGILKEANGKGYICIPSGNHDMFRVGTGRMEADMKVVFAFLLTMPGMPFIYYGDEIGMEHNLKIHSKECGFDRTGARTPMQWNNSKNMGFSGGDAKKLYLPVDKKGPAVSEQVARDNSLWSTIQRLIALRKSSPALCGNGTFKDLHTGKAGYPFIYERVLGKDRYIIALNPSNKKVSAAFTLKGTSGVTEVEGKGNEIKIKKNKAVITLNSISYSIYKLY